MDEDEPGWEFRVVSGRPGNITTALYTSVYSYRTVPLTATENVDYGAVSGTLTLFRGATSSAVRIVPLIDDDVDEYDEIFAINLVAERGGGVLLADYHVALIIDNDDPPVVSIPNASGREDAGVLTFNATLSGESAMLITVDYATSDGTAASPADYGSTTGTLTFAPGETAATLSVPVVNDGIGEQDETFTVTLSNPVAVTITNASAIGTILDTGANPTMSVMNVGDSAGAEDTASSLAFEVRLEPVGTVEATASWATADGTAVAGVDYTASSGELTFAVGDSVKTIEVPLLADTSTEDDETFTVTLSNLMSANRGSSGTGTIQDDDDVRIEIADGAGGEASGLLEFPVTANGGAAARRTVLVPYQSVARTATAGVDYEDVDGTLTFVPGTPSLTISLTVVDDNIHEGNEAVWMYLVPPFIGGYTDDALVEGTIVDNDPASTAITLSADPTRVQEDDGDSPVVVTATLNASARSGATPVTVSVAGSGAVGAVDFDPVPDFTVTIAAGETSAEGTFVLTPQDDAVDEIDETLAVTGRASLSVIGTEVLLADDDEAATEIALTTDPQYLRESDGDTAVAVTATLRGSARGEATAVTVSVAGSGEEHAVDFDPVPDFAITIAAGDTRATGTFELTPENDLVDEEDETLSVTGVSVLPVTGAEVTIADDDETSTGIDLQAVPSRIQENAGPTEVVITATLDAGARTVATNLTVSGERSRVDNAVDFAVEREGEFLVSWSLPAWSFTIEAGATSATTMFTLTPENDSVDEVDETLSISGVSDLPVTGTEVVIADNDEPSSSITLAAQPRLVSEGAGPTVVTVTATLDAGASAAATVVDASVAGTGLADAVDFDPVPDFKITIAPLMTSGQATFVLTPRDDLTDEDDETLSLSGTSALPVASTSVTLADDDEPSTRIVLSAVPASVSEDAGDTAVVLEATLDAGARTSATMVDIAVEGGGDPDAVDFDPVPGFTVVIEAEQTVGTATFTLSPEDDGTAEENETLAVSGTAVLPVTDTTVLLTDDDTPSTGIALSAVPALVSEGAGTVEVTVTASLNGAARTVETTVAATVTGSGDPEAVDFGTVPGFEVSIPVGATQGTGSFMLEPEDDAVAEVDETLTLSGTSDLQVTGTSITLADDDETPSRILLVTTPGRLLEGAGSTPVVVTATLDRGLRQGPTVVTVTVAGSGRASAVDFAPVRDFTLTIPAGAAIGTATFSLVPDDDDLDEDDETLTLAGTSDLPVTSASMILADDDEASSRILLAAAPERVSENAGPTPVAVTATLDRGLRAVATPVTVTVAGTGEPGSVDFEAVPDFVITIPANAASGTGVFELAPEDDQEVEADERLTVSGSSDLPVVATSVTLADDDEVSTRILLFLSVDPAEASEGGGPVRVTVTASLDRGVRPQATRIDVTVAGSGDPDAVDYSAVSSLEIVIPANELRGTAAFRVTPEDDEIIERDETITVSGTSDLPVTPASMTLVDDDEASIVLSVIPSETSEDGGPVDVTVTATLVDAVVQEAVTVSVSVTGSGDPNAVDFQAVPDFAVTIDAGGRVGTATFTLTPEDDSEDEADETLTVTGTAVLDVVPATVTLTDDDAAAPVAPTVSVADNAGPEGAGELAFVVTLSSAGSLEAVVRYATSDGTALAGSDYRASTGSLTFAPGETMRTIRVALLDDDLHEVAEETFAVALTDASGATIGMGTATGVIRDDDAAPAISVVGTSGSEAVGSLGFAVTLDRPSVAEVTVRFVTADGTASAGSDYETAAGTLTFVPGETAGTIRVAVLDDELDEADEETLVVSLSDPSGGTLGTDQATGVIRDDDAPPAVSVADAAGDEGVGSLVFAATLDAPSAQEVAVAYGTMDGTATAGDDYEAVSGMLTFAPGEVGASIRVAIIDDAADEPDEETFTLTLGDPRGATVMRATATGTIRDDDLAPPTVAVDLPTAALCVGGAAFELDLAAHFAGEELGFSAVSSAPGVATAALAGRLLTITPVAEGNAVVTVAAANAAGAAEGTVQVRVVADPAELVAVESVLASIGRGVLAGVAESVAERIALRERGVAYTPAPSPASAADVSGLGLSGKVVPTTAPPGVGAEPTAALRASAPDRVGRIGVQSWETPRMPVGPVARRGIAPFAFSLGNPSAAGRPGRDWSVWGRGDVRRFESGVGGASHDGTLGTIQAGADVGSDDWLAGISVQRSESEADYRFERSLEVCGRGGEGAGLLAADLTSIHPYAGRRLGGGWVWAAVGAGRGETSVERCESGHVNEADLRMRLAVIGGRHPFGAGERVALSVVEDVGVLELTTGTSAGPVGDRSVSVGRARLGLEAAGIAPAGCRNPLTTYLRALARRDWGDGATGTGLELAGGVRYRNAARRLGLEAGLYALAAHTAQDSAERGASVALSVLPRTDGTGLQGMLTWERMLTGRHGPKEALAWTEYAGPPRVGHGGIGVRTNRGRSLGMRLGYGLWAREWSVMPFAELDLARDAARLGVRHEFERPGRPGRRVVVDWGVGRDGVGEGAASRIDLTARAWF